MPRGSSMKLRLEDMPLFGLCPSQDEFYLVVCEHCEQVIKPQALRSHIESRHPHSLEHRWSDSPTPASVVSGGGGGEGRSGDGAASRLSANPSPTPDGSTASSSLSAGGPSSRSTPSPKRSDSAGKTASSPSLRSLILLYTIRILLGIRQGRIWRAFPGRPWRRTQDSVGHKTDDKRERKKSVGKGKNV